MACLRWICWSVALAMISLALAGPTAATRGGFQVIVHPSNPASHVSRDFLRDAFLKKELTWQHGEIVHPIALAKTLPAHRQFTEEVLHKTVEQLRIYWVQQIFSGKGVPPLEVASPSAAIAQVLAKRGAIAYLPAEVDPGRAKPVAVR